MGRNTLQKESLLYTKILGSLLGGIIGDAMGAPAEKKTYQQVEEEFGEIRDFSGVGTDDTIIKHILCDAIKASDGYVSADEWAAAFGRHPESYTRWFTPVRNMFCAVQAKLVLPVYAGMGNQQSSSSAMAITPMGLINACNPRQAALETYDVAGLIHGGTATFCRDAACAIAAAVAEAMKPEATVDSVLDASVRYLHPVSSAEMITCIGNAVALARKEGEYKAFRRVYYETSLRTLAPTVSDSRETVPCCLALIHLAGGDVRQGVIYAANFGRDADTIATMTGSILGALHGVQALGSDWVDKAMAGIPGQEELALMLAGITRRKSAAARQELARVDSLL
jgi:ADP-ribosylglycohydrolase